MANAIDYSFDFGLPADPDDPVYGLWEPMSDRFLFVTHDISIARTLSLVASSRYLLYVIDISKANNYFHTLIDNTCCNHWSLVNRGDIMTSNIASFLEIVSAAELVERGHYTDWPLDREMQYLQICNWWMRFMQGNTAMPWYALDRFISKISPGAITGRPNVFDEISILETKLLAIMHTERDNQTLWDKCIQAKDDSADLLRSRYEFFSRNHKLS